jgi:hypothetical protein
VDNGIFDQRSVLVAAPSAFQFFLYLAFYFISICDRFSQSFIISLLRSKTVFSKHLFLSTYSCIFLLLSKRLVELPLDRWETEKIALARNDSVGFCTSSLPRGISQINNKKKNAREHPSLMAWTDFEV